MKELENKILEDGRVIGNDILKVDSFINHQIDCSMLCKICEHISKKFLDVDKIVTIETSGIAFAVGVAMQYGNIPVVFAKKQLSKIIDMDSTYQAEVKSFTKGSVNNIVIDKRFLKKGEKVLIVDDVMTTGSTLKAMVSLIQKGHPKCIKLLVMSKRELK